MLGKCPALWKYSDIKYGSISGERTTVSWCCLARAFTSHSGVDLRVGRASNFFYSAKSNSDLTTAYNVQCASDMLYGRSSCIIRRIAQVSSGRIELCGYTSGTQVFNRLSMYGHLESPVILIRILEKVSIIRCPYFEL